MPAETYKTLFLKSFLDSSQLLSVMDALGGDGSKVRVIGGAVRNVLRGVPVSDVDVATIYEPQETIARVEKAGFRTAPTGIEHGTITVIGDKFSVEVTTLREDIETNGRHAKVRFGKDWLADAQRRDFTMNALAVDQSGHLYDLVDGLEDCLSGKVQFIGDASARIHEDALRILRFLRFSAHYGDGSLEPVGLSAIKKTRGLLVLLSAERVQQELKKLLSAPKPLQLASVLNQASQAGVLPGFSLSELEISPIKRTIRPDPLLQLVLLLNGQAGKALEVAEILRFSKADQARIAKLNIVLTELKQFSNFDQNALFLMAYEHGKQHVFDGLYLRRCLGDDTQAAEKLLQNWTVPVFPLSGRDLIAVGHKAGPNLGQMLSVLEKNWIASQFSIAKAELIKRAEALKLREGDAS
ncbi:MAG: hypothetical protein COA52_03975 [Hyphomicrobiales bacterium]|nr:MAG: hypothetical protein COA52_03975 [Hyphomicrobiales bacterium]